MRFTKEYSKLKEQSFHTIRKNTGFYKWGKIYQINTPEQQFKAKLWRIELIKKEDITNELAQLDADCSREELIKKFENWYGEKCDNFVLLFFSRKGLNDQT